MAGTSYTRQSTIQNNETIEASLFNNEFNKLLNTFAYVGTSGGTTGHRHDGTAAEGGNIYKVGDEDFLNKIVIDGQLNGANGNDRIGFFVQVSSAAVEQIRIQDGVVVPVTDSDIDLGTSSVKYKHVYADDLTGTLATAAQTNITSVGALGGGSIASGFGAIDNGSSTITTTGAISGGTLTGTLQTAAQANITSVGVLTGLQATDTVLIKAAASDSGVQATPTPILELYQEDGPQADDGDHLGEIQFTALNNNNYNPIKHKYAGIHAEIIDESNGTEDGSLHFTTVTAGTDDTTVLTLNGTQSTFSSPVKVAVGPLTINSGNTNADLVIMNNEQSSADASPIIELYRSQYNGADGEDLGKLEFYGSNDRGLSSGGPLKTLYGSIFVEIADASNGSEDGQIKFTAIKAGSATDVLTLNGTESTFNSPVKVAVGPLTINSTNTNADLVISNNEASSSDASPIIELYRQHGASGHSDGDDIGKIEFYGVNSRGLSSGGPEKTLFGSLFVEVVDSSDGTEDGTLKYSKIVGGAQQTGELVTLPLNGGVQFPAQSAAPSAPANGQVYYDTDDHKLKLYANGAWVNLN